MGINNKSDSEERACARLEGRPQVKSCQRPSFETALSALLRMRSVVWAPAYRCAHAGYSLCTQSLHRQRALIAPPGVVKLARDPRFFLLQREDRRVSTRPIGRHQAWARIVVRPTCRLTPNELTIVTRRQGIMGVGKSVRRGERVEKQRTTDVGKVRLGAVNGAAIVDRDRTSRPHQILGLVDLCFRQVALSQAADPFAAIIIFLPRLAG